MTMNATPRYPANPNVGIGVISVANTNKDGTDAAMNVQFYLDWYRGTP